MTLREDRKGATYAMIAETALRLFAERGYDDVTVDEIAAACGMSERTFFRYFSTKGDAIFADGEARRVRYMAAIDAQPLDASPFETIEGASKTVAREWEQDREIIRARFEIVASAPSLRSRDASLPQQWDNDVISRLRDSGRADALSDLELRLIVGAAMTAQRVALHTWVESDERDLADLMDETFGMLARGLGLDRGSG